MQACKPGSVSLQHVLQSSYHLSSPVFAGGVHRPTHPVRSQVIFDRADRPPEADQDLFGLSTRKVYHASIITDGAVGSYHHLFTFSTQHVLRGSLFSVALSVPRNLCYRVLPVRKYDALCCPDFPPRFTCAGGAIRWLALGVKLGKRAYITGMEMFNPESTRQHVYVLTS
jgi:hypothetical protein